MRIQLDTFNILDPSGLPKCPDEDDLDSDSPPAVRANLELDKLDKELFPFLVTGVRLWPFLTVALSCRTKGQRAQIYRNTRKMRRELGRFGQRARMGPLTWTSLRPYVSMCKKVAMNGNKKNQLWQFINTRRFNGNPRFFSAHRHEKRWKKALLDACGRQGRAFVRAYKDAGEKPDVTKVVNRVITKPPGYYDKKLWQGAFSYAFLRCLYGYYDRDAENAYSIDYAKQWSRILMNIINSKGYPIPHKVRSNSRYLNLLQRIIDSGEDARPPLAHITKRFRRQDRPVLEGLRLGVFYNLYFRTTPFILPQR